MGMRPGQAKGPYVGRDGGGSGDGFLDPVISLFDPTGGLPPTPALGDRYLSTATANGWTADYIYEWNGASWSATVPENGNVVFVKQLNQLYAFDFNVWRLYQDYWFKPVIAIYDNTAALPS